MKLIVLDRDGVINHDSDAYIKTPEEWHPIPGSLEAIACLNHAGYRVVVATNQSGLARGLLSVEMLHRIHARMHGELAAHGGYVEAIFVCPHHPDDGCGCRKPEAGLLRDIAARLRTPLEGVPMVGDALRDLEAARRIGARPVLVRTGKGEATAAALGEAADVSIYPDLAGFTEALLQPAPASRAP